MTYCGWCSLPKPEGELVCLACGHDERSREMTLTTVLRTRWVVAFQVQEGEPFETYQAREDAGPPGSTTFKAEDARDWGNQDAAIDEAVRIRHETKNQRLACAAKVETRVEVLRLDEHFARMMRR